MVKVNNTRNGKGWHQVSHDRMHDKRAAPFWGNPAGHMVPESHQEGAAGKPGLGGSLQSHSSELSENVTMEQNLRDT